MEHMYFCELHEFNVMSVSCSVRAIHPTSPQALPSLQEQWLYEMGLKFTKLWIEVSKAILMLDTLFIFFHARKWGHTVKQKGAET